MGVIVWVSVPGPALSRLGITLRAGAVLVCSGLGAQKWTGKAGVARRSVYWRVVDRGLCPPRRTMDPQLFLSVVHRMLVIDLCSTLAEIALSGKRTDMVQTT